MYPATTRSVRPESPLHSQLKIDARFAEITAEEARLQALRLQIKQEAEQLRKMGQLSTRDIEWMSMHPDVRAAHEADLLSPYDGSTAWLDAPETPSEPTQTQEILRGDALTARQIENLSPAKQEALIYSVGAHMEALHRSGFTLAA